MELIKKMYLQATSNKINQEVTKGKLGQRHCKLCSFDDVVFFLGFVEELLQVSQTFSQVTPLEVEILFLLADLLKQTGLALSL